MVGLKLFRMGTTKSGMTEVTPHLAEVEADVQALVEAHMETLLGVRFLASEYSTGPVHGGRIDSLGLDENGSPVIAEITDRRILDTGSELRRFIDYMSVTLTAPVGVAHSGDALQLRLSDVWMAMPLGLVPTVIVATRAWVRRLITDTLFASLSVT
nr:endonuclease NucS domain-containing protein [Streptomyces sp. NY05-11A]